MSETDEQPDTATHDLHTAWQRTQAQRRAERRAECAEPRATEFGAPEPDGAETQRAELLRCADAFERTAARLRKIVGDV